MTPEMSVLANAPSGLPPAVRGIMRGAQWDCKICWCACDAACRKQTDHSLRQGYGMVCWVCGPAVEPMPGDSRRQGDPNHPQRQSTACFVGNGRRTAGCRCLHWLWLAKPTSQAGRAGHRGNVDQQASIFGGRYCGVLDTSAQSFMHFWPRPLESYPIADVRRASPTLVIWCIPMTVSWTLITTPAVAIQHLRRAKDHCWTQMDTGYHRKAQGGAIADDR